MSILVQKLTEQALTLSVNEREELASSILASTHNKELTENDSIWLSLAEERYSNLTLGKDEGIKEIEFFKQVRSQL